MKQPSRIICCGRGKGKMMAAEEWLETLPKEVREKVIIVKASDSVPELRGNKLPRIVDYDMLETSAFTWRLWEELMGKAKKTFQMKKYKIRYKEVGRSRIGETTYIGPLSEDEVIAFFGLDGDDVEWYEVEEVE